MSLSPTAQARGDREGYEAGFVALHKLMREGESFSGHEAHCAYLNLGGGSFADVSAVSGLGLEDDGRAVAAVDWDLDGDLDLWIAGRSSPRVRLMKNRTPAPRSLFLALEGRACNRDAIGARVEVYVPGEPVRVAGLRAGEGYLAQSSKWLAFGLGAAEQIERVVVHWPGPERDGLPRVQELAGLEPGGRYRLVQGEERAQPWSGPAEPVELAATPLVPIVPNERNRVLLAARVPLPSLPALDAAGRPHPIVRSTGAGAEPASPRLLMLWASWCAPCVTELGELSRGADEWRAAGLRLLALSADTEADRPAALELLDSLAWPFERGFTTPELIDLLEVLANSTVDRRRPLPLPSSFLIDGRGRIAAIYRGPVEPARLREDLRRLDGSPEELREHAAPFPGLWRSPPPEADLAALESLLAERGLETAARELALERMETTVASRADTLNAFGLARARAGRLDEAIGHFRSALAEQPDHFEALFNLASALHQTGEVEPAIELYERAHELDARHTDALHNLVLAYWGSGRRAEAERALADLRVLDPDQAAGLEARLEQLER